MYISRVEPHSLPKRFPTLDVLEVIAKRPLRERGSVTYPKAVVESMANRKLDAGSFWILSDKCTDALCKTNSKLKKSFESAQKFFTRKTTAQDAILWAQKQVENIGKQVEVPKIGRPLEKIG